MGDPPDNVKDGVVQVKVPPDAVAPGGVVFWVGVAVAEEVHPLTGFVTTNTNGPLLSGALGFCWGEVKPPGPLQAYVTPAVGEPPDRLTAVEAQVTVAADAVAPGAVVLLVTATVAERVQPLEGLFTVTV